jgi:uncharacterized protein YjiK
MADLTDDQVDRMLSYRCIGTPNDLCKDAEAVQEYVRNLQAAVRRGRRIEAAVREIAAEMIAERDRGSLTQSPDYNLGLEAIADDGERVMAALDGADR